MKRSVQLTEAEIIERISGGEKSLYEIIVRRYNSYLYKIGRSCNYNHQDTQDLMQDTYVDAYRNLLQFEHRSCFKIWLIRIMLNNCYRKKEKFSFKNEHAMENIDENARPMYSAGNDVQKETHSHDLKYLIEKSLQQIPDDYQLVFSLRAISELNVAETASLLNISEANVKVRLNRAKAMLRAEIEKSYSVNELFEFNLIYCDTLTESVMKKIGDLK